MARMLVIEDHIANLELMTYLIDAFGHTPLIAGTGRSGIAIARHEQPDLVVCDIQLPDMSGCDVAQALKADPHTSATPLIAVTAFAMAGDREQILAAGFQRYLSKPIIPETFIAELEALLAPAQRSRHARDAAPPAGTVVVCPPVRAEATILVVDDSPLNHELLGSMLMPLGYTIIRANNVHDALLLAREQRPELILSELHMPDQDGFDLIRAIRADPALYGIAIVIHSATFLSEQERRKALELGATTFIARPIEPHVLLADIDACLKDQREQHYGNHPSA